ncbi:putative permease, partial [Salmonella enterica subsp. enterica serovar Hadar str. ATCC 51956]
MTSISTLGAIAALVVAIVLILRKVSPAYGMMAGALVGGLIGGADLLMLKYVVLVRPTRSCARPGNPASITLPITRSFYTPSCRCQARGAVNLTFRIVKYLLFLITIIKQK